MRSSFDLATQRIKQVAVRVRLPNLPSQFWNEVVLKGIAKDIAQLISINPTTIASTRMLYASLCINVDLGKKLPGTIWLRSCLGV